MKIFIDAGHNYSNHDTGATGNGLREQDINFLIADKLKKILEHYCEVKISRNFMQDILGNNLSTSLSARYKGANEWGADLFVSIHCNSMARITISGTETLVYSTQSKTKELAENIANSLSENLDLKNRGVKYRPDLAVLKNTNMPAVLIETAFISNKEDSEKLRNRQDDFAKTISTEIIAHYKLKQISDFGEDVHLYKNTYTFYVNNNKINMQSVVIGNNNYVNLRDIVQALNGKIDKVEDKTVYIIK